MKTSLIIEDALFREAQKEAQKHHKTLSETISYWARLGFETLKKNKKTPRRKFKSVNLGGPAQIDLNLRRNWLDKLDS